MKCESCGRPIVQGAVEYAGERLCRECLNEKAGAGNRCPCCGAFVGADDGVGLILARPAATPLEKAVAETALVIVCPKCRVLFFDGFQYNLLRSRMNPSGDSPDISPENPGKSSTDGRN